MSNTEFWILNDDGPFKAPGHLGLPRTDLAHVGPRGSYEIRLFRMFSRLVGTLEASGGLSAPLPLAHVWSITSQSHMLGMPTPILIHAEQARTLMSQLLADPRVSAMKGMMISSGTGATVFEESRLATWYLWCANEYGVDQAKEHLERWLSATDVDVVNTMWVHGLDVDDEIELTDGYRITPARLLPDSTDKERALQVDMFVPVRRVTRPLAAITRISRAKKLGSATLTDWNRDPDIHEAQARFRDISIVLNALPGVSCLWDFATSYSLPTQPYGPFSGSGGTWPIYDVIGGSRTKITAANRSDILAALHDFDRLTDKERQRFRRILSRLSQAKRRHEIEDKIVDLGIALEMLLLNDNANRDQLALSFRLRGAWLVSETREERLANYRLLKDIYTYRSHVVHTGLLEDGRRDKIENVRKMFPSYLALAERICRQALSTPAVDWETLLIGRTVDRSI